MHSEMADLPPQKPDKRPSNPALWFLGLWFHRLDLNDLERRTFFRHIFTASLYGICNGVMGFGAFLLRKHLQGSELQVVVYTSLIMAVFIFSTVGTTYLTWRNHRSLMALYAVFGPLSMALFLFHSGPYFLICIFAWVHLHHSLFLPAQNMIFRSNYRRKVRGVCYARAQAVRSLVGIGVALLSGWILDKNP